MKANYTKPFLAIETFMLAQTTVRDCSDNIPKEQITLSDINSCAWDLGGTTVFISKPICDLNGEEMGFACYNNPSEGMYIFRS